MKIGVISYLPNDETLRNQRKEYHNKQLNFFKENLPEFEIVVCAQNYKEEDYDNRVTTYLKFETPIGFSKARNELLKYFYNTNDDYMVIADDDSMVYLHYDPASMLRDIAQNPSKFYEIDYFNSLSPNQVPFKKGNYQDKDNIENNYKFTSCGVKNCNFAVIKNFKKFYNTTPLFDEQKDTTNGLEDVGFLTALIKDGYVVATCPHLILKAPTENSVWNINPNQRREALQKNIQVMLEEYKDYGLTLKSNGYLNWNDFYKRCRKGNFPIYIPRAEKYIWEENLIPKESNDENMVPTNRTVRNKVYSRLGKAIRERLSKQ